MRQLTSLVLALAASAAGFVGPAIAQSAPEPVQPPPHISGWPNLGIGETDGIAQASLALGPELERGQSARAMLADRRRLDTALAALQPQRKGVVDAYVVSIALDSDPVFSREAREAGRVLTRRYDAAGRSITLAGPDGRVGGLPSGSISSLTLALARVAELMDPAEDVLVLFTTSHGAPQGLAYHQGDTGFGILAPYRLGSILQELGIKRRIVLLSACYSGVFVPYLANGDTAIMTAASSERTSFGCRADNDWTFFGDALINHAMRKPQGLSAAAAQARQTIASWENANGLQPSEPQILFGDDTRAWLPVLEGRVPKSETQPVGAPATDALKP